MSLANLFRVLVLPFAKTQLTFVNNRLISNVLVSVQILPLMMINLYHAPAYVVLMREVSTELVVVVNAPQRARVSEKKATKIMMSANLSAKLRHSPVIVMREPVSA